MTAGFNIDADGRPDPDELAFLTPQGGRRRQSTWNRKAHKPAVEAAGTEWPRLHGLAIDEMFASQSGTKAAIEER
jgi:hypothetical protein